MKTLNLIVYRPGFVGNFTKLVLSLDPSTQPYGSFDNFCSFEPIDITARKSTYSFQSLQNPNNFWHNHHLTVLTDIEAFFHENNPYQILNFAVHPPEFYRDIEPLLERLNQQCKINFISIVASDAGIEQHVEEFKRRNGNSINDRIRMQEIECYHKFNSDYDPIRVSLDEFFSTDEAFINEYLRISTLLDVPLHIDHAIEFYHDWRLARDTDRIAAGNTPDQILGNLKAVIAKFYANAGIFQPEGIGAP